MATAAQIQSVIVVSKQFDLTTGNLTLTDISNYAGALTLASPYRIYGLFQVIDPNGTVVYINSGYVLDDFSSPDVDINASDFTKVITIPTATGGGYLFGTYTVNYKVQVIEDFGTTNLPTNIVTKLDSGNLCQPFPSECTSTFEFNCNTAIIKNTDTTAYGAYSSLTRVHSLIPPPLSNQPTQTGNQTVLVYNSGIPYTGTWSWLIESTLTYAVGNNTTIIVEVTGEGEQVVVCDTNFCKLLCVLLKYRGQFLKKLAARAVTQQEWNDYNFVWDEYAAAYQAQLCGKSSSQIQQYIDKIYEVIGIDDACDCGCDGETPTPILATTIINGADGADGTDGISPLLQVSGGYIQVSYDNGVTWTNLLDINAIVGQNGTTVLFNEPAVAQTTVIQNATTASEDLFTESLPANTFQSDGDIVEVEYQISISAGTAIATISFGGVVTLPPFEKNPPFPNNRLELDVRSTQFVSGKLTYSKYNSNSVLVQHKFTSGIYATFSSVSTFTIGDVVFSNVENMTVTGLNFASTIPIVLNCTASNIGAVSVPYFIVTSKKIGNLTIPQSNNVLYGTPFTTTPTNVYTGIIGSTGKTLLRVYLDGILLQTSDWSYNNGIDTITFAFTTAAGSTVNFDYI
jgi:hypothetical protein